MSVARSGTSSVGFDGSVFQAVRPRRIRWIALVPRFWLFAGSKLISLLVLRNCSVPPASAVAEEPPPVDRFYDGDGEGQTIMIAQREVFRSHAIDDALGRGTIEAIG